MHVIPVNKNKNKQKIKACIEGEKYYTKMRNGESFYWPDYAWRANKSVGRIFVLFSFKSFSLPVCLFFFISFLFLNLEKNFFLPWMVCPASAQNLVQGSICTRPVRFVSTCYTSG